MHGLWGSVDGRICPYCVAIDLRHGLRCLFACVRDVISPFHQPLWLGLAVDVQMMKNQDNTLEQMEKTVKSTKHIALAIGEEVRGCCVCVCISLWVFLCAWWCVHVVPSVDRPCGCVDPYSTIPVPVRSPNMRVCRAFEVLMMHWCWVPCAFSFATAQALFDTASW